MILRLVNWNIERRGPQSWQARSLMAEIEAFEPDLVCLTEAHDTSLERFGGHSIDHVGYRGAHKARSERLVVLWSRTPWQPIDVPQNLRTSGGIVAGYTRLEHQDVLCIGLCIPYHMAKLRGEERTRPWHHHKIFLSRVTPWLTAQAGNTPVLIMGDFNQRIPRKYGSREAHDLLVQALAPFEIITRGPLAPLDERTIDHVCASPSMGDWTVQARSRFAEDGRSRSDHFGVFCELTS